MKFIVLTQYYLPEITAPSVRLSSIASTLQKKGHDVEIVTTFPSHRIEKVPEKYRRKVFMRELIDNVKVTRVWAVPHHKTVVKARVLSYASFMLTSLFGLAVAGKADAIFVHSPPIFIGLPALLAARAKKALFILSISDLWPEWVGELGIVKNRFILSATDRFSRFLYARADRIVAVSEGIQEALIRKGVPAEKIIFLPNGVDIDRFKPLDTEIERSGNDDECRFLYAGNLGIAQDFDVILEAAEHLQDLPGVAIEIVGEGPLREQIEAEIERRRLKNVSLKRAVPPDELVTLYARARASLVTLRETQLVAGTRPSKIIISLSCGKPVIYAGRGEAAELIQKENCGIVVEPGNAKELAAAMRKLCDSRELAKEMGRNGRRLAEQSFSWDSLIEFFLQQIGAKTP